MGLCSNNCGICYYPVAGIADSFLVVYICGASYYVGSMVYALLLIRDNSVGKERGDMRVFVFKFPRIISRLINRFRERIN